MPAVEGDRVTFSWEEADQSHWCHRHAFEIVYPGLRLDAFSKELFLEIFLSLQLPVFGMYRDGATVQLPLAMPRSTIEWWTGLHRTSHVVVTPSMEGGYSAWSKAPVIENPRSTAVFYGGGKDSTLARCVLAEAFGEEEVLLVQMVHPFHLGADSRDRLRIRQQKLMLDPVLAGTRLAAATLETDFVSNLTQAVGRPHTNLYTMASLPILLRHGAVRALMSNEITAYWCRRHTRKGVTLGYSRSRPEVYAAQAGHLRSTAGIEIEYASTHFPISEFLSYKILHERYPDAFAKIVMCVYGGPQRRWCMNCRKCAEYVHFGLVLGHTHRDFDYDSFWTRSSYIQRLVELARIDGERVARTGNQPWHADVSHSYHFASFCHTMSLLRDDAPQRLVPPAARETLGILASGWGNKRYQDLGKVSRDAIELADSPSIRTVASIFTQHAPVEAGPFRDQPYMNMFVDYDFRQRTDRFGHPVVKSKKIKLGDC